MNEALDLPPVSTAGIVQPPPATIRSVQQRDRDQIHALLVETGVFKTEEIDVAMELVDIVLEKPNQQDYEMYCCVDGADAVVGFLCIGPTPITKGTFDLYWIAVKPGVQRHGVGKRLLSFGEEFARSKNGRLLVAETSSQPSYASSRAFYLRNGFTEVASIADYYDVGDDLIIYVKQLQ